MWTIPAFLMLSVAASASSSSIPRKLNCIQAGVWGCGADDICIDTPRGKGRKYSFNIHGMTFKSPEGKGRISALRLEGAVTVLLLSDGHLLRYDPEHTTRWGDVVVNLRPSTRPTGTYSMAELWCKP